VKVVFDSAFLKRVKQLRNPVVGNRVARLILKLEAAESLASISGVTKLQGFEKMYRVRLGDYRVGFELEATGAVRLIFVGHRKDVYKPLKR